MPIRAEPGTLLHGVGAPNPICNLARPAEDGDRTGHEAEVLFGDRSLEVDATALAALSAACDEKPAPTELWPTVRLVLDTVLGSWDEALPWPTRGLGPTRAAATTAVSSLTAPSARAGDPSVVRLLSGARTGEVGYEDWDDRAGPLRGWPTYLSSTTVCHLDLCLERALWRRAAAR